MKLLIENANILTMDEQNLYLEKASLGVADNRIDFIGEKKQGFQPEKSIDAGGKLLMPGLINAHTHMPMTLFRNYADDLSFHDWLFGKIIPIEEMLDGDAIYWGTLLGILESVKSGVTCFNDMYFFLKQMIEACEKSGIRAVLGRGLTGDQNSDTAKEDEMRDFHRQYAKIKDSKITFMIAPHAPYTCDDAYLKRVKNLADELSLGLHIHLSESEREVKESLDLFGKTPIQRVFDLGLLENHVAAAHCVHVTDTDLDRMAQNNFHVLHNPGSNMKLANGFAPVQKMLYRHINVALGTDGAASNNNLNLFEEINYAGLLHKATSQDPLAVTTMEALKMATVNGAKALCLEGLGQLKVGYKADMILIDMEKPHYYPKNNPISSLVYSAQAADVDTVICDGNILMEKGQITFGEEQEIFEKASESIRRLKEKMEGK